jgi:hypothetical protein
MQKEARRIDSYCPVSISVFVISTEACVGQDEVMYMHAQGLLYWQLFHIIFNKGKTIPVTSPWRPIGLWNVEAPTFPLDNRLTDGGEVVSLTRRPSFTTQEDSWYSFLLEAESDPVP